MRTAVELDLPVDARSVHEARDLVAAVDGLAPARLADAQLIASELVTNALQHAGLAPTDRIVLTLRRYQNRLRIDVDDAGAFTADSETFLRIPPTRRTWPRPRPAHRSEARDPLASQRWLRHRLA